MKCCACQISEATWAWQPFGPNDDANCFTLPGSHYRGFTIVKVCNECKDDAQSSLPIEFEIDGQRYIGNSDRVAAVPGYVGDPIQWWAETQ